ncbi:MAG: TIGR00730 family Rossman fold protein [Elusimicrobia bacterium]|nr:TIGR00730 family Rossman fold protein [Elusimicrobiota bacterium]
MSSPSTRRRIMAITSSPSYRKAFEDIGFLKSEGLRPVRLQLELLKPDVMLEKQGVKATVVVFGSARITERAHAQRQLQRLEQDFGKRPKNRALALRLAAARALVRKAKYYDESRRFAALISRHYKGKGVTIVTGGGPGIMEAANRGADDVGAKSMGLNITLPFEQDPNPFITPELCFQFHYFAVRKMHFLLRAKALVVFPGGYGTMDELFEALTLIQTGKMPRFPVILVGRQYWAKAVNFRYLVEEGVVAPKDEHLFHVVETAQEAFAIVKRSFRIAKSSNK